jgi:hypothetical protein
MSHQVKTNYARSVDPCSQGITGTELPFGSACMSTQPSENLGEYEIRGEESNALPGIQTSDEERQTKLKINARNENVAKLKKIDRTLMITQLPPAVKSSMSCGPTSVQPPANSANYGGWTQQQQRQLELALNQFPKGTADRWDRIAEVIPGKTKVNFYEFHVFCLCFAAH